VGGKSRVGSDALCAISAALSASVDALRFCDPVSYVYNPLDYAWDLHKQYLERFGQGRKEVLYLGMNPGPWGMAQTGVPFGEVAAVRDWMKLEGRVRAPVREHPKRKVSGLDCDRSEVSGARLWGWVKHRYGEPANFFETSFVTNYCPLVFMEETARNRTPDKLPASERAELGAICDHAFRETVLLLRPRLVVGVGLYAEQQAARVLADIDVKIGRILHPSPASPIANRGWAPQAEKQLEELGVL
jgi:single-strand selective monofunctional uracil DNA glycosylase